MNFKVETVTPASFNRFHGPLCKYLHLVWHASQVSTQFLPYAILRIQIKSRFHILRLYFTLLVRNLCQQIAPLSPPKLVDVHLESLEYLRSCIPDTQSSTVRGTDLSHAEFLSSAIEHFY
jgi:hypothetical protein